jgi:hypothetical protein
MKVAELLALRTARHYLPREDPRYSFISEAESAKGIKSMKNLERPHREPNPRFSVL